MDLQGRPEQKERHPLRSEYFHYNRAGERIPRNDIHRQQRQANAIRDNLFAQQSKCERQGNNIQEQCPNEPQRTIRRVLRSPKADTTQNIQPFETIRRH